MNDASCRYYCIFYTSLIVVYNFRERSGFIDSVEYPLLNFCCLLFLCYTDSAEDLKIPVDYITAQRLHQCLRTDYVEHHVQKKQQISQGMVLLNEKSIFEKKIMKFFSLHESGVYSRAVWI